MYDRTAFVQMLLAHWCWPVRVDTACHTACRQSCVVELSLASQGCEQVSLAIGLCHRLSSALLASQSENTAGLSAMSFVGLLLTSPSLLDTNVLENGSVASAAIATAAKDCCAPLVFPNW